MIYETATNWPDAFFYSISTICFAAVIIALIYFSGK